MNNQFSFSYAALAGLAATTAMTLFTYMTPLMGIQMNIPVMLAGTFGTPFIIGWLMHYMIGTILAINYAALFLPRFGGSNLVKAGVLFSIIPWLMAQIIVMPMMAIMNGANYSAGFFSGSIMMALASLMGHLLYGVVLGLIYKPGTAENINHQFSSGTVAK